MAADPKAMPDPTADSRVAWILRRVTTSLTEARSCAKMKAAFFADDNAVANLKQFVCDKETQVLYWTGAGEKCTNAMLPPKQIKKKSVLLLKPNKGIVTFEGVHMQIIAVDLALGPLEQLSVMANEIYAPMLASAACKESWSETIQAEVMSKFHAFLSNMYVMIGITQGKTLLPLPPDEAYAGDPTINKDKVHLLESAIVRWSKQINAVLKTDPEAMLAHGDPEPLIELEFWVQKARNLNAIFVQLDSEKMKSLLTFLTATQNQFGIQFQKMATEVTTVRAEANENARYLNALKPCFDKIKEVPDFINLSPHFRPLFHCMMLIWKQSQTYNTNKRLVCLMRELCNQLIRKALDTLNAEKIFEAIEQNVQFEALARINDTMRTIVDFKEMFEEYQKKFQDEGFTAMWTAPSKSLFMRLDAFYDRCIDMADMLKIVVDFAKLDKISIGGTKGAGLSNALNNISEEYKAALLTFKTVTWELMDVRQTQFDDHFFAFRTTIKNLEPRLAAIILQAFDDSATIVSCFKLFESFDTILDRPPIAEVIEPKYLVLMHAYAKDCQAVTELFHQIKKNPPVHSNQPPVSGCLGWCRALLERVKQPFDYMQSMTQFSERADFDDLRRLKESSVAHFQALEAQHIEAWTKEAEMSSQAKLKQSLLRRDPTTQLLAVNFDKTIVKLLREVKFFIQMKLQVNETAMNIFHQEQTFRYYKGNLEMIVNMYNEMSSTLLPVERPLFADELAEIDEFLESGIKEYNWKSPNVVDYILECLEKVRKTFLQVQTMKSNMKEVQKMLKSCADRATKPMMLRKVKTTTTKDFYESHRDLIAERVKEIKEDSEKYARILGETQAALENVESSGENWLAYVGYFQSVIVDGLAQAVANNLAFFAEQINPETIAKKEIAPLLNVNLSLIGKDLSFLAFNDADMKGGQFVPSSHDIWGLAADWAESFFQAVANVRRVDEGGGIDYLDEVRAHPVVLPVATQVTTLIASSKAVCEKMRDDYLAYDRLFKIDVKVGFQEWLKAKSIAKPKTGDEPVEGQEEEYNVSMADLDEQILKYKALLVEISDKATPLEAGWLRVDMRPVKAALGTHIGHWIEAHINYLKKECVAKMQQLNEFMAKVEKGIKKPVEEGDDKRLREVLGYIYTVRQKNAKVGSSWELQKQMALLLKKHGHAMAESDVKMMEVLPTKWKDTVEATLTVQQVITPLQNAEVDNIKALVQKFMAELEVFRSSFRKEAPFDYREGSTGIASAYQSIFTFTGRLNSLAVRAEELREMERLFELNVSSFRDINLCRTENRMLKQLWDMNTIVFNTFDSWKKILWDDINTDDLLAQCRDLKAQAESLPRDLKAWKAYVGLVEQIVNLSQVLPLVNTLHEPTMQTRHWDEVMSTTKKSFVLDAQFSLGHLVDLQLHLFVDDVEDIVEKSRKEAKIDAQLKKISDGWKVLNIEFMPHKDSGTHLIRVGEEITQALEEHMVLLQGIQNQGKYVKFFIEIVNQWMSNLGAVETVLRDWGDVQTKWASLETIFMGSADIRLQLPEDSKVFDTIDEDFRTLMKEAQLTPGCIESCTKPGRATLLEKVKEKLERCEKSLNDYLNTKKKIFPRFYFLSDVALLDILSNGNNPQKIQKHLADCFDNIQSLKFELDGRGDPTKKAVGMFSKEGGEYVDFCRGFMCEGAVEDWLNGLVDVMRDSLREVLNKSKEAADGWGPDYPRAFRGKDGDSSADGWCFQFCAQVVVTTSQIMWTEEVIQAFDVLNANENAMRECLAKQNAQLDSCILLVLNELTWSERIKIITLITIDVHSRDVVQGLIEQRVENPTQFQWLSQLRYFWQDRNCIMRVCDAEFLYSFEFIGNPGRLVITPLTDRCYITLTQALRLIMGGAPAGPAGTGKTETTKDLGRGLAVPVYVFNCSSQMNIYTLGDIFKGLCQTGGWGCFDEFNRIALEVLSVVSAQVMTILQALKAKQTRFDFMSENIRIFNTVGMFITMNPGYAGRTELPESLKALFRPCAMVVPDFTMICENMLLSEGFLLARIMAKKMVTLYRLGGDLLSKQAHYDWGLRAFKSVLRIAGGLKRADPTFSEDMVMLRALRDFNLPKIVDEDKVIFVRIINDLFPGIDLPPKVDPAFNEWVKKCAIILRLQPEETFVRKVANLKELLGIRHSVFTIGPAGAGKSEVFRTLLDVYNAIEKSANPSGPKTALLETINPKAVTSNELFGYKTAEWHDGVLSVVMRDMARNNPPYTPNQKVKWVVLDGDIDPEWIESLNTVMDDNKVLTLVSNERIPLTPAMRMMFEISNLKYATPATVSRAGILFISERDIGWKPFVDTWIQCRGEVGDKEKDKEKVILNNLFNKYVKNQEHVESYRKLGSGFKYITPISEVQMVQTICRMMEALTEEIAASRTSESTAAQEKESYELAMVFACIWAYGGSLYVEKGIGGNQREIFSNMWRSTFNTVKFEPGLVFDFYPDFKQNKFVPWTNKLPKYVPGGEEQLLVSNIYVPTVDTFRLTHMINLFAKNRRPVLFVGNAGTGKTTIIREYLRNLSMDSWLTATINFNSFTDSGILQNTMEQYIDKRSGRTFGPAPGKRLIYFIDDLNMPYVDKYGTQSPIELLMQHINYGTLYDRKRLELKKEIKDCQYLASMNNTAGSFTVNDRLTRHFAMFACVMPTVSDMKIIYKGILDDHFRQMDASIQQLSEVIINASIGVLDKTQVDFLPNAEKFMYQFNLREMTGIVQGLCLSSGSKYPGSDKGVKMVRLWAHECMRVFSDRFITEFDVAKFQRNMVEQTTKWFEPVGIRIDWKQVSVFTNFCPEVQPAAGAPPPAEGTVNGFVPTPSYNYLLEVLTVKLEEYNESNANMELVLFEMAMEHICRIARIIGIPRGNALLVGVGGSGKQSLARLASYICGYKSAQIAVTANYGMNEFRTFLQDLYKRCAEKNESIAFLLTDTQIVNEGFLVYVNDMLSSGFIPDLFQPDDYTDIFDKLRKEFSEFRVPEVRSRQIEYFINKVRAKLHIVLCFSPVGDAFRVRARKFPALVNCTSMDYFHGWPKQALEAVALRFLEKIDIPDHVRPPASIHMAMVHSSVLEQSVVYKKQERRYNYATPKSFLELISFYGELLETKRKELNRKKDRLEKGLNILRATATDVGRLKEDLIVKMKTVEEKKESARLLIIRIGEEKAKVSEAKALAKIEEEKSSVIAKDAAAVSAECEAILNSALPKIQAAQAAVDALDKTSLVNLSALKSPPEAVGLVTRAVIALREGKKKSDWKDAQKMLKGVDNFLKELKAFGPEQIVQANADIVIGTYLPDPKFTPEAMMSVSSAASALCAWVINILAYFEVWKETVPKTLALNAANEKYAGAMAKLKEVQDQVAEMERMVQQLNDDLQAAMDESAAVQAMADKCIQTLGYAERLVGGLAGENIRWTANVEDLEKRLKNLTGDTLLGAAFVSYIGAFNMQFRLNLWQKKWLPDLIKKEIPLTPGVDPLGVLAGDSDISRWKSEGLPADRISLENGAILNGCSRWPLMIDPQLQGVKWIKNRSKALRGITIGAKQWLTILSQAMGNGDTVLIENIGESLDAVLDPILSRAFVKKGRNLMIKVGDELVDFHPKFKLILQTKLLNPHYKPEIAAQCTLINFIVTEEGLEDQLLAMVVNREKPELEETKTRLVMSITRLLGNLDELESDLLEKLSNADPDRILEDLPLIEGLEKTKAASVSIEQQVKEAKESEILINTARNEYRMVAADGSWIFFLLIQLAGIEHMYQYSLESFIFFFFKAMDKTAPSAKVEERVAALIDMIRIVVYTWVSRGLFGRHKLILCSQLCFKLMRKDVLPAKLDQKQFEFLLVSPAVTATHNPMQDWLPLRNWQGVQKLIELNDFASLGRDMEAAPNRFKEWYNTQRPEATALPGEWRKMDEQMPFGKLLITRVLRPDRMIPAITDFVANTLPMGTRFTQCDQASSFSEILHTTWQDSKPNTPIFFILSPGADPVLDVVKYAKKSGFGDKYHNVSMGQGQDVVAMEKLAIGHKMGHWIVLQNIHLMPIWCARLEKQLDEYHVEGSHPDFRVFLSAEPSNEIPIGILERSIKLTNEPPQGLKANVKRAFATMPKDEFEFKDNKVKSILFGLCHFHAVVLERKKFLAAGWNRVYPFSTGDLTDSCTVLFNYLDNATSDKVPWDDLRYIFGEIMYGGHITDDWDRRLCRSYLLFFMREELFDEMDLFPFAGSFDMGFRAPPVLPYGQYIDYIDRELQFDTPVAFGLHPNAEISVKTTEADALFALVLELQPRGGGGEDVAEQSSASKLEGILAIVGEVIEINDTLAPPEINDEDKGPFQNVFLQEIDRMLTLVKEIRRSINELNQGLEGSLTMSPAMEALEFSLTFLRVPDGWLRYAFPSLRPLPSWLDNLKARANQLKDWAGTYTSIPLVTDISYLFNPQSFLTAIMQNTAQKYKMELDKLIIQTEVTKKTTEELYKASAPQPREGAYITGLALEGARWDKENGVLAESLPKELVAVMPVINCKAALADKLNTSDSYLCPVYKTQQRGPTYVFTAQFKTKEDATKWVLAGLVGVLDFGQ